MTSAARPATLRSAGAVTTPVVVGIAEDPQVRAVFTGRSLDGVGAAANLSLIVGDGPAVAARRAALDLVGLPLERAVFMHQVHGGDVAEVGEADAGRGALRHDDAMGPVDAMVTTATDVALAVLVADCVPVVLADPGRAVGVVHAGRGGVMAGVVPAAVRRLSPEPHGVVAVIGPSIGGCCYEVPEQLAAEVGAAHPVAATTTSWGTPALDLPGAVRAQLEAVGVRRVEHVAACTRCNADAMFSHRAATAGAAAPGRQAGLVVRTARAAAAPPEPVPTASLESQ